MGNANERETGAESLGSTQGSGLVPTNDGGGNGGSKGVGAGGGLEHGGLPGVSSQGENRSPSDGGRGSAAADSSAADAFGKGIGQWVIKNLEYQLAYHSSSIDWYQVEVEKCQAKIAELEIEIVRYGEAKEWHQGYLNEVEADYRELTASDEV